MRGKRPSDPVSSLLWVAEETVTNARYRWDNEDRGRAEEAVVQVTLEGEAYYEDSRGRVRAGRGTAILFTHNEPSRYGYPADAVEPYRLRYLTLRLGALTPWFERLRDEFGSVLRMAPGGEAAAVMAEIQRRFAARAFRDRLEESELLHRLLVEIYREQVAATEWDDPIEFGHHLVRDHYRSPINLKEVAARCGVSREHFIREFHRRYGEAPGALLRRLRLEQGRRMLRATSTSVQDVAVTCGFADANTFCRAYRRSFGVSPGQDRAGG